MRPDQAEEVVLLMNASTRGKPEEATLEYFRAALAPLDYKIALAAATTGTTIWRTFPSWAEFKELYTSQKRLQGPVGEQRAEAPKKIEQTGSRALPFWVKRWVAARLLYEKFGRARDMRLFREQQPISGPGEVMPDNEWVKEAEAISDREAIKAVTGR